MNLRGPHTDYFNGSPRVIIDHLNAETMTVMMVESRRAIDNLREILKVPGLDCIMIGPDDLCRISAFPARCRRQPSWKRTTRSSPCAGRPVYPTA